MRRLALLALAYSGLAGYALGETDRVAQDRVAQDRVTRDRVMPAVFDQETVFLKLPAPGGSTLRLYTDTGGGTLTLSTGAARHLQLPLRHTNDAALLSAFGPNVRVAQASEYMLRNWPVLVAAQDFVVIPGVVAFTGWPADSDGGLGNAWFAGQTWSWDYAHSQLILRAQLWHPAAAAHEFAIGFKTDAQGSRSFNYPRMSIRVDAAEIAVLFDTGAATVLTPNALKALNDGKPARRATSLIVHSVFEAWHARHPDWRIVDDAQLSTHARMILVPSVEIAGFNTRAVWFTERGDEDFHETLTPVLNGVVNGAIGGNAFAGLVVSVDYRASRAWVSKPSSSRH